MPRSKRKSAPEILTEVELEIMDHVWRLGECSVHDILQALPPERELAYTSVSTMLRILEKKQFVVPRKEGRSHLYAPQMTQADYQATKLRHVVGGLFQGSPSALVRRLVDDDAVSEAELSEMAELIKSRLKR